MISRSDLEKVKFSEKNVILLLQRVNAEIARRQKGQRLVDINIGSSPDKLYFVYLVFETIPEAQPAAVPIKDNGWDVTEAQDIQVKVA